MRTVDAARRAILGTSQTEIDGVMTEMRGDPDAALRLLTELTHDADWHVRDWVTWAAPRVLGTRAIDVLLPLVEDANVDVRIEAMHAMVELDRSWVPRLIPRYLSMLNADDPADAIIAIWTLVRLREPSTLATLRGLAKTGRTMAIRNNARVARHVLEGDEDGLIAGLQEHAEHNLTFLWAKGLAHLGTQRALESLEEFARAASDRECRDRAQAALVSAEKVRPLAPH